MSKKNDKIDVSDVDPYELLAALHTGTQALGMGVLQDRGGLTAEQVKEIVGDPHPRWGLSVDYLAGRPLKVSIREGQVDFRLYDRDAGAGAGARVLAELRGSK